MSAHKPRVSIGMPVYNGEKYIEAAIDSILAQTFSDFEFIISDNASVDRTQEICLAYASQDGRIHYHRNAKNLGAAPNYNRTFALSTGEYFKWADHDDSIAPTFLEKCVEALDQNPEAILSYSQGRIIDDRGMFGEDYDPKPDLTSLGPHQRFRKVMFTPSLVIQLSGLIRANVLKKIPGYGTYPASDEVLLAELALYGQFYEIPERLFNVRLHSQQSTFGALVPGRNEVTFSQRDRISFFDTSKEGTIVLPHWLFFFDSLRAVRWAPLSSYEQAYCYAQILRWALRPDHFRALGKDLLLAAQKYLARTQAKPGAKAQQATQ